MFILNEPLPEAFSLTIANVSAKKRKKENKWVNYFNAYFSKLFLFYRIEDLSLCHNTFCPKLSFVFPNFLNLKIENY